MDTIIQNLEQEIDFLAALVEFYRRGDDREALCAAEAAKAALERLAHTIAPPPDRPSTHLRIAA